MINFKNKDDILPSMLIVFSIIIMAGTLVFMLMVPRPSAAGIKQTALHVYNKRIADAETSIHTARVDIAPRIWTADPDTVSASVLGLLTQQATAKGVKIGAFRPQRAQALTGITEYPFIVQVSGSYMGIRGIMKSLDASDSKVVLRSVQVSSSEDAGMEVTVTLGLSAYVATDPILMPNGGDNGKGK